MNTDFTRALEKLGEDAAFKAMNEARPPGDYLFATLLPEEGSPDYHVSNLGIRVRATMAGFVGMDSPYPPGGVIQQSDFSESTLKVANQVDIPEGALRKIQALVKEAQISGGDSLQVAVDEAMNFLDKMIIQPHMDCREWMRARCLIDGEIQIHVGDELITLNYGIPAGNLFNTRTGNNGYGGSTSYWWTDLRAARKILRRFRAIIMNSVTADTIIENPDNNLEIVNMDEDLGVYEVAKIVGSTERRSTDSRDTVRFIVYDAEADVLDPTSGDKLRNVPFVPDGKILIVGPNDRSRTYIPGEGSTPDPANDMALGRTHIAPTTEGGGRIGAYARLYQPDDAPWSLRGKGAHNSIPVLEAPDKVVVLSTQV